MAKIKVIFSRNTHPTDIFSYLVRLVTWSNWSHVGVITSNGTVIESTYFQGGVHECPLADFKARSTAWEIREFEVSSIAGIESAGRSLIGKPYNFLALFGLLFHIGSWKGTGSYFCSELVTHMFAKGGTPLFNIEYEARVSPQLIWMLPSSKVECGIN